MLFFWPRRPWPVQTGVKFDSVWTATSKNNRIWREHPHSPSPVSSTKHLNLEEDYPPFPPDKLCFGWSLPLTSCFLSKRQSRKWLPTTKRDIMYQYQIQALREQIQSSPDRVVSSAVSRYNTPPPPNQPWVMAPKWGDHHFLPNRTYRPNKSSGSGAIDQYDDLGNLIPFVSPWVIADHLGIILTFLGKPLISVWTLSHWPNSQLGGTKQNRVGGDTMTACVQWKRAHINGRL